MYLVVKSTTKSFIGITENNLLGWKRTSMRFFGVAYEISDEIPDNDYISYKDKFAFYNKALKLI